MAHFVRIALLSLALTTPIGVVQAKTLFFDDFNGSEVDQSRWLLPTGAGTFFGRTQIKPPSFNGQDRRPGVFGGSLFLTLDTYNPSALTPGDSFWGHEVQTQQVFEPGSTGISVKARIRMLNDPNGGPSGGPPGGIVGGFFLYNLKPGPIRDEIDFELLSNDIGQEKIFTNVFADADFGQRGMFEHVDVPGLRLTEWTDYELRWYSDRIEWYVDGQLIREETGTRLSEPHNLRVNWWAPDAGFLEGYDALLQPAAQAQLNETFTLQIDYVEVSEIPLPAPLVLFASALSWLWIARRRMRNRSMQTRQPLAAIATV